MSKRTPTPDQALWSDGFLAGVCCALICIDEPSTLYEEIVTSVGMEDLLAFATKNQESQLANILEVVTSVRAREAARKPRRPRRSAPSADIP